MTQLIIFRRLKSNPLYFVDSYWSGKLLNPNLPIETNERKQKWGAILKRCSPQPSRRERSLAEPERSL